MLARLLVGISLTALVGWFDVAQAATPPAGAQNVTVSPTQLSLEAPPGQTITGCVTVINDGATAYDFKAYAAPYRVSGEGYDQSFELLPGRPDVAKWISAGAGTYHATPHQNVAVPYALKIPAGTKGGGYYAVLFYETIPQLTGGSGVESKTRIGVVAYIKVTGDVVEKGQVASFAASGVQYQAPITATLRLANSGNVHYPADIHFVASDMFGRPKATIHVAREVLPDTIRRFDMRWEGAPALGLFRLGGTVDLLGHTESLPVRYVLIVTPQAGMMAAAGAIFLMLLVVGLLWWRRRLRG